jgi:hypothetical protein
MKFHFTTTAIGLNTPRTAAQVILPAYPNVAATTRIAGRDETLEAAEFFSSIHANCTGEFCAAVGQIFLTAAYDLKTKPTPAASSHDHLIAQDGPQNTGVAVIDILI